MPLILIIAMLVGPAVLFFILRVNAALVFLSLCLGSVLVQFVGPDAQSFVGLFTTAKPVSDATVSLGLLFLPAICTTIFMIRTIRGKTRAILNVIPSLAFGVVGFLLAEPLLSGGLQSTIATTTVWSDLLHAQDLAVGVSAIIALLFLWLQRPKRISEGKGKHHRD